MRHCLATICCGLLLAGCAAPAEIPEAPPVEELFAMVDRDIQENGQWFGRVAIGEEWVFGDDVSAISRIRGVFPRDEIEVHYNVGDRVRINDGPLESFTGVVEEIDAEKNKVTVVVSMFGRETPVEMELEQVEVESDA